MFSKVSSPRRSQGASSSVGHSFMVFVTHRVEGRRRPDLTRLCPQGPYRQLRGPAKFSGEHGHARSWPRLGNGVPWGGNEFDLYSQLDIRYPSLGVSLIH